MAYKPYDTAREADLQYGDSLASIAAREQAQGNDITADDIARFNWGTDNAEYVQELLRDELGATERNAPHDFMLTADDDFTPAPEDAPRGTLKIPEPFRAEALPTDQAHTFYVRRKGCPKQFIACSGLATSSFDFDSSFLRPDAKADLRAVQEMAEAYPDSRLFVFGHTDAVSDDLYNKKLSERRAWCVYSFLTKDPLVWETLYSLNPNKWGIPVIQVILAHLGYDPGPVDGDLGPRMRAAMRRFLGLPEGAWVQNDAAFRVQLFEAYMTGPDDASVPADRFCADGFMGCGEFNLAEATDNRSPKNRRVTVFAFHKDRLPNFPCAFADVKPCWTRFSGTGTRYNPGFSCSFYDTIAEPCSAENEHHSVSLLIRKYPVTSEFVNHLMDEFELRSACGKLGASRKAMSASTRDETYLELRWEHVRAHMTLTLVHKLGDGERVILSEVPFTELYADGHVPRNDEEEDEPPTLGDPMDDADEDDPDAPDEDDEDLEKAPWEDEY